MGRFLLITALLYGYGDAGFDGHRPASLDRPLRNFHRTIDRAAQHAQRALVAIDDARTAIPKLPKLGDALRRVGEALTPG